MTVDSVGLLTWIQVCWSRPLGINYFFLSPILLVLLCLGFGKWSHKMHHRSYFLQWHLSLCWFLANRGWVWEGTVSLWDVHMLHRDTGCTHSVFHLQVFTQTGNPGTAHAGTCSHPGVFARTEMHVLTQSLYMCKLLIAHIQTLKIKLVLDALLLFFH